MNENIDLTQILKDCPKGWKFYSSIHGELLFSWIYVSSSASQITFIHPNKTSMTDSTTPITVNFYRDGRYFPNEGECTIFPSKDQRDWSKFTAPWYKNEEKKETKRFNPNTLKMFDRVIVRKAYVLYWSCDLFSYNYIDFNGDNKSVCIGDNYSYCIPYNDDTKHLVGTTDEAPEYYQYWKD